ncbi:MAG: Outer membrane TonB-dependent transporter, utilization system for glycans and polysaccharides (PUL), SusC family [uncultured Cytophagales bacterium]|uniref:Outer membrane TonB-dependent transporter, utilization system for glycans and polysaccharides (PUL), SusC family n=1 Tax=uncultured Cytophagales bacterium TaxID=158755 RepID=A0A6J4HFY2_9SPHI|nr:MAG: Outer membrane TonB-dependent transporter, utilization system for glycans and polysaccharides (PUL), SusC family [uncultured Cytophagales bacterium]
MKRFYLPALRRVYWMAFFGLAAPVVQPLAAVPAGTPGRGYAHARLTPAAVTVTGRVTGDNGETLPGVNVLVKGTTNGTTTGSDGSYSLSVPDGNTVLVFSFIGYLSKEVPVGNRTVVDVQLATDTEALSEVVVVGYGTQQKKDVTGAIASLDTKSIRDQPVANVAEALTGRLPGVLAQQVSGLPGSTPSIKVRGIGSISAGNSPLIVVDGQPLNNGGQNLAGSSYNAGGLNTVNPGDIEKIDVLKDASATSIYGSRGSNGVIMITTKRGKPGPVRINLDYYTGIQEVAKKIDLLNAQQFAEFSVEATNNAYLERVNGAQASDPNDKRPPSSRYWIPAELYDPAGLPNYNYQDLIFRRAPMSNYQLSAAGGSENVQYYVAGNYFSQDGIIHRSGLDRYSLRANLDARLGKRVRAGLNLSPSYTTEDRVQSDGHWLNNGIINAALAGVPYIPIHADDGSYTSMATMGAYDWPGITNPVANITEIDNEVRTSRLLGSLYAEIDILDGLKYRGTAGVDNLQGRRNYFRTSRIPLNQLLPPTANEGAVSNVSNFNWVTSHTLTYTRSLGGSHRVEALLGTEFQKNDFQRDTTAANKFPNDVVRTINYGTVVFGHSSREQWDLASYFARVNYSFKDRYLFTATVRRDGSSRFGVNERWGTFPSASVGWRVAEEAFMQDVPVLSELKLRASYGLAGNNAFGNYPALGLLGVDNYVLGNNLSNGLGARTLPNDVLTWEKSRQADIGAEVGLFNDRIYLNADYYRRITTDLLLQVQVPTLTGFSSAIQNIGRVRNQGVELALTTRNLTGAFTWTTDANVSFNRNEVLALGPTGDPVRSGSGIGETNITVIGQPVGNFFGYKQLGVFLDQTDLDAYPHFADTRPGDVKYEDVSGDGRIDAADRTTIGNNQPDFIYGLTNTFGFKGVDLTVVIQGVQGGQILNLSRRFFENLEGSQNQLTTVLDRWRSPENPGDGKTPRGNSRPTGNNNAVSSRWVEDASYLRIRNVTLGYNLPAGLISKVRLQAVRLYAGVQNAFTFTRYLGYNPEVSGYESAFTGGVDYGTYPLARTYTVGVNLGF